MATEFDCLPLKGLKKNHLRQLLSYLEQAEEDEWYYGNREQFERRHAELKRWLEDAVQYAYQDGVRLPR